MLPVPGHHGLANSVVGRMRSVGGHVLVESQPGAGTTVTMEWAPVDTIETPTQAIASATAWSWVERLGLTSRFVWFTYFAPQLTAASVFAVMHLANARSVPLAVAVLTGQICLSMYCARAAARLALSRTIAVALIIANGA